MGVPVRCTLFSDNDRSARTAARRVFDEFGQCDAVFSDWRPETEAMRLCARADGSWQSVSRRMLAVLRVSVEIARVSEGAFDITVGPLVRLWRETRKTGRLPSPSVFREARGLVGIDRIEVDSNRPRVRLAPGTLLDFGGIAKGYAAERSVAAALRVPGIRSLLVEAGGDIAMGPPPPGTRGWRIALPDGSVLETASGNLSTSGDDFQTVEIAGRRYAHIVDPRTGLGAESVRRSCVHGAKGGVVDAVATAGCLVGSPVRRGLETAFSVRFLADVESR